MLRGLFLGFLISLFIISITAIDTEELTNCNCDEDDIWSIHNILECQKVSDFLIAIAYFSIPLELIYFISCSDLPFKCVLVQFIAFIVLCGLTHLLNGLTYTSQPSFQLIMSLTIAKILTALVSCATAITLLTLFPLLLKFKVRELFLTRNVLELDQEVGMIKKQKDACIQVRMLTSEIRKSLDKHTILYTTLVELSKTLNLENCAVWMPNENRSMMNLTHGLSPGFAVDYHRSLPIDDPDVLEITKDKGVRILRRDSVLAAVSNVGPSDDEPCSVAAIRMPLLCASDFKGGTPELVDTRYAILVLVMPSGNDDDWRKKMEIVEVVADQVAMALSHATVLEESKLMREKLEMRNSLLQQAKENAVNASQARNSFQKVMNNGMRRPMHSILGLLSILQDEKNTSSNQRIIIETMLRTSTVLSSLINDAMDIPDKDVPIEMMPFQLHSLIREASCLVKCLCFYKGFGFSMNVPNSLPNFVMGDEKRTFQVLLHMVGHLLNMMSSGRGSVVFKVILESGTEEGNDKVWEARRHNVFDEYVTVKFDIEFSREGSQMDSSISTTHFGERSYNSKEFKEGMSFRMCKKLVQMMQGKVWMSLNTDGHTQRMTLVLRFLKQSSSRKNMFELGNPLKEVISSSMFKGLQVLLADEDDVNRMVTKKLLEKLGCQVIAVSTGFQCLSAMGHSTTSIQMVILDLHMPEMDGFEVAMRVRKFHSRSWPLIIAQSATTEEQVWEKCLQVGINGLIRKPVLLRGMVEELQRVLQRAGEGF